jgi:hypothetical protein
MEMDENILQKYNDGISLRELSKIYSKDRSSIKSFLLKNNIKIRSKKERFSKIKYNELFFLQDSNELYYFWGFMLGDGSLTKNKSITISLNKKDISILEKFCNWLKIDQSNIKYYKNNVVRLNIYSRYFKDNDLSKFGIIHNKTYNPIVPSIPNEYIKPFILGLLDADGHISFLKNKYYAIEFVNNNLIIDWFVSSIRSMGFNGHINFFNKNKIWKRFRIRRKKDVIDLIKILDIENYFSLLLERKWKNTIGYIK